MERVSAKWRKLFALIPGYDPIATAATGERFDEAAAEKPCAFFCECLTHIEGKLAGKPFVLEPWQQAVTGCLFGWKRAAGSRRYREALVYIAKKNGKTPWAAGIGLYVQFCDDELGQQNVCAAAEREQAALVYRHLAGMIRNEPELSSRAKIYAGLGHRSIETDKGFFKVISADAHTKHGGNLHLAVIDELHAQPNRDLVDVIQTSMASENRRQPLLIHLTTSDFDRESICNEKHDYASKVRDGAISDSAFLPVIYEASADDDWTDPKVWAKANPNLGVSVSLEYLERECKRAQESPAYENTFKRMHLNIRTETEVKWLDMEKWNACGVAVVSEEALVGRRCFGGLDLSSKVDVSAFVLLFPPEDEGEAWKVVCRFWVPGENAHKRERRDRVPYLTWAKQGFVTLTDGNRVDYAAIQAQIEADSTRFGLVDIGADPWGLEYLRQRLDPDGDRIVEFYQNYKAFSEPTKELESLVLAGRLSHGGNPVLKWMAANTVVDQDHAGNFKPNKRKSTERIDGIVALIMALGRATQDAGDEVRDFYESHELELA